MEKLVQISIYINEADQWKHTPLHLALLDALYRHGVAGGTVIRGVAGFTRTEGVQTTSWADVGAKLPLIIQFIDKAEKVEEVLPLLKMMSRDRLIIREEVERITF